MPASTVPGLIVAVAAVILSIGFGLLRRSRDGRVRNRRVSHDRVGDGLVSHDRVSHDRVSDGLVSHDRVSDGLVSHGRVADDQAAMADGGWPRRLGAAAGAVTLLQFSSEVCAPCRAASRHCADLVADLDWVRHVEVDAAAHLAAARALGVWRTPTILVIDGAGQVAARVQGVPRPGELRSAVTTLMPAAHR